MRELAERARDNDLTQAEARRDLLISMKKHVTTNKDNIIINHPLLDIMVQTVNCRHCWYSDIILKTPFVPPRGWAGGLDPEKVHFIVVTLNPGHPMQEEILKFKRFSPGQKLGQKEANYLYKFATDTFKNPDIRSDGRNTVFHRKMKEYIVEALVYCNLVSRREAYCKWLDYVWLTDLFKCSTIIEAGPNIPKILRDHCRQHLIKEINYFNPKAIIAMHSKARDDLKRIPQIRKKVVYFRHPSNGGPTIYSETFKHQLQELKHILESH